MIDCVVVHSLARVIVCQKLALIFSGESLEEGSDLIHLGRSKFHTALIDTHIANGILESLTCSVVIIWPCMLHIAESRHFETMTVTLDLSLLVTAIVLICQLEATVSEIMTTKSHKLI
jgi:hypothetical protein